MAYGLYEGKRSLPLGARASRPLKWRSKWPFSQDKGMGSERLPMKCLPGKIYQVRGFDLANISFIKGDTGWIIFYPLTAKETARAALAFINEKLGQRPVMGVVYSHSHVDHFGGVRGVVDEADFCSSPVSLARLSVKVSEMLKNSTTNNRLLSQK